MEQVYAVSNKCFHVVYTVRHFLWIEIFSKKGIFLVSRCVCCVSPQIETLDHLIVHSELARSVWSFFAAKLKKNYVVFSFRHLVQQVWMHGERRVQMLYTPLGMVFFGCCEILKHRCQLTFAEGGLDPKW